MRLKKTIAETRSAIKSLRLAGKTIGFVPTMGALHEGHLALVRAARRQCDAVIASIFVNPTQFGPNEDLARYPRPFEQDCALLEAEGVDLLFAPASEEMYPEGATTFVTVEDLSSRLDGASRPGHFRGVATVVAKLFHIVQPDVAFFGQKDAAQVAVLRRMVRDLNFDLEIAVIPTVREPDGLAMSSRNRYLSPQERKSALALSQALSVMESMANTGERDSDRLLTEGRRKLATEPGVRLDYLSIVHPETLEPLENVASGALIAVAAYVGTTRLIDNILLPPAH
jgi:pantoate--beta-alanine ligase